MLILFTESVLLRARWMAVDGSLGDGRSWAMFPQLGWNCPAKLIRFFGHDWDCRWLQCTKKYHFWSRSGRLWHPITRGDTCWLAILNSCTQLHSCICILDSSSDDDPNWQVFGLQPYSPLVTPEVWRGHPKCGVEHATPVPKEASACLEDQTSTIHCSWL